MKTVRINGHKIEIYNSIDELPVRQFHKFNKYMLIDSGIGSSLNDIDTKVSRIGVYLDTDKEKAALELNNLKQLLYFISEEINPQHYAYMTLIYKVDGALITDYSEEGIKRLLDIFKAEKIGWFSKLFGEVKKKIDEELGLFFPDQFNSFSSKEFFNILNQKTIAVLEALIKGVDNLAIVETLNSTLLTFNKPKVFFGTNSSEIRYEKQFENLCILLKKEMGVDPDRMTVLQFYNTLDYINNNKSNGRKPPKI